MTLKRKESPLQQESEEQVQAGDQEHKEAQALQVLVDFNPQSQVKLLVADLKVMEVHSIISSNNVSISTLIIL
jgi:membrane carboxypeptidase/penicillin-binding protein PbpC